jgi:DNA-directed RNA polymerase subunit K/omega
MSSPEFDDELKLEDDQLTPELAAVEDNKNFEIDNEDVNVDADAVEPIKTAEQKTAQNLGIIDYDDDDDDDDDDNDDDDDEDLDESLRKLEKEVDNDIILKHHPEIIQNNYDEIIALCNIVRNDKGIIVDDLHKTYPFITKYEYARVIGMRAKQLNNGADPFVKVDRGMIDGYTIALKEMEEKKIPFIIARPLPNGGREYWKLSDLELIHF